MRKDEEIERWSDQVGRRKGGERKEGKEGRLK